MMRKLNLTLSTLCLLFLASCTLHPNYERPSIEMAENWHTPLSTKNAVDIRWWGQFSDPILDNLITKALYNNQDLKAAMARVDQVQAQLGISKSKLYPQLQSDGTGTREKTSTSSATAVPSGVASTFNTFGWQLNASYLVDVWGEIRSGVEAADHQWLASIEARRTVVLGLISSVASTYFQLRQYDQQLLISIRTQKDLEHQLYLATIRFELGLTSQIEVEQAIAEVKTTIVEVENRQIEIAQMENLLCVLIGEPSVAIARGCPLNQIAMIPAIPDYLPSEILNQRPDIRAAEHQLIAANAQIGVAKAKFFPQLSLNGALGAQSLLLNNLFTYPASIWEYGTSLIQEVFTGGRLINNLRLTEAMQREALHQYVSTVLTAFKEVNNALTSHKIFLEQVETEKTKVESLARYLHLSNLRYKEGQIDYLTFLDAERQFFQSQLDCQAVIGNSFLSLVQIYQALGGSWVIEADANAVENRDHPK
jgi:multidrug efflux system outer membrane protein